MWTAGTGKTFFVDDNTFTYNAGAHTDWQNNTWSSGYGSSYTTRYNDYVASPATSRLVTNLDSHPGYEDIGNYATQGKEAYGNTWTGFGRLTYSGGGGQSIVYYNYDADTSSTYVPTGVMSYLRENSIGLSTCGSNVIPAEQGRTSCNADSMPQHPHRNYEWANWYGSTPTKWNGYVEAVSSSLRRNIDFFNYNLTFGTRASGNSTGTGCGTLAARPATCNRGVVYWATDQSCSNIANYVGVNPATPIAGMLYRCSTTDTWTAYYTPYTYPHPLRTGVEKKTIGAPRGFKLADQSR